METEIAYLWDKGKFRLLDTDNFEVPDDDRRICTALVDADHFLLLRWNTMRHVGAQGPFYLIMIKRKRKLINWMIHM